MRIVWQRQGAEASAETLGGKACDGIVQDFNPSEYFNFESKFRDACCCVWLYPVCVAPKRDLHMTYQITGLARQGFAHLIGADKATLALHGAVRVVAVADRGWPCRISLDDAKAGESLILLNHISHDVATPYRSAYAIYVRENAGKAAEYVDQIPPVFQGRPMAFRAFDQDGMLHNAALALPGEADTKIRALFEDDSIAYIHAHNAAHGCFSAKVERA
jgi:hypothetical protein